MAGDGLSVSDAIRLLLVRIAADKEFPFSVKTPNATTRKAIAELENGKGKRFASAEKLFKDWRLRCLRLSDPDSFGEMLSARKSEARICESCDVLLELLHRQRRTAGELHGSAL